MAENPNRKAWVLASPEILEELQKDWSRPVQARATENPDGSWDMTFRTCDGLLAVVKAAQRFADFQGRGLNPILEPDEPSIYEIERDLLAALAALKAGKNA